MIGTDAALGVETDLVRENGKGTGPEDVVEGRGQGETLDPASLYEDQRARRAAAAGLAP